MVLRQITLPGSSSSTLGSFAVFSNRASDEILMPGAMVPPIYSASGVIAQNVVAVPRSITISGPPYLAWAPTAFTILSAPTCLGLSYFTTSPVLIPGPMTIALLLKYFCDRCCSVYTIEGTTVEIITSFTSEKSRFSYAKSWWIIIPYSSALLRLSVSSLQLVTIFPSLNTPNTMFVFPTSNANNISYLRFAAASQAVVCLMTDV